MTRAHADGAARDETSDPPSGAPGDDARPVRLGPVGWLRWAWRRLTRMSTALVLLGLVALAAVPGGILPQRGRDDAEVARYIAEHAFGPLFDRLSLFSVFTSPWFVACYLLLFVSLVGCIVPRCAQYVRALRAGPPAVPHGFERFEERRTLDLALPAADAVGSVAGDLRRPYRVTLTDGGSPALVAVRGKAREAGNLTFHAGLVACLIALSAGQAFAHSGQVVVVEGSSVANALVDYNSFSSGVLFDAARLEPFTLTLDALTAQFTADGRPDFFEARVTVAEGSQRTGHAIRVNRPATIAGTGIYLMGNGYAPHVTVTGPDGRVAFSGAVPFLVQDGGYTSDGVIKVPDIGGERQLGLTGVLYPTAVKTDSGYLSVRPEAVDPKLVLTAYAGDLGLDAGVPQNAYELDTSAMTLIGGDMIELAPGQSAKLPENMGTIRFDSLPRFAAFDLTANPGAAWLLAAVLIATLGLSVSLFTPRRRLYARATPLSGGCRLELAGQADGSDAGVAADLDRLAAALAKFRLRERPGREGMEPGADRDRPPGQGKTDRGREEHQ